MYPNSILLYLEVAIIHIEMIPNGIVRLGLIQHACQPGEGQAQTIDQAVKMICEAADRGAQIVATQELFYLPYFPQTQDDKFFDLAEPIPGATSQRLGALAKQQKIYLIASLFERCDAGVFHNTAVMFNPSGQIVGKYRKMHIPDDPWFFEKYYFTPGDLGWPVQRTPHASIGMLICWDQWFPEAARLSALGGAQIIICPTAIAWCPDESTDEQQRQREAWLTVQRANAINNGVFFAAINRTGIEQELTFWGGSFVADPSGKVIAEADDDQPQIIIADCDLSQISQSRQAWPFLRDRRVDAYDDLRRHFMDPQSKSR